MMNGYNRLFWAWGKKDVIRAVDIPARSLAIEPFEILAPISLGIKIHGPGQRVRAKELYSKDAPQGFEGLPGVPPVQAPSGVGIVGPGLYGPGVTGV